jgi:hypothetical protein
MEEDYPEANESEESAYYKLFKRTILHVPYYPAGA